MKRFVQFSMEDGTQVVVEVNEDELEVEAEGGLVAASRTDEIKEAFVKAKIHLRELLGRSCQLYDM
ncbi:hypothetical protein EPA93_15350 [Ktedonosporobacter rubrisoli]|uniref:Uncharacterized protein n=1 Tax=Ktedonosporobacter rubrisoli TaxID=2509675 RepID=A0A4P6JPY0_KTERU|nr:hypothetical protein [Ktedonosporobacter rubrisoli]QBD77293.1 hypothetical protein EPA93_15350 [Ktedonosporobacter rubrisoli]